MKPEFVEQMFQWYCFLQHNFNIAPIDKWIASLPDCDTKGTLNAWRQEAVDAMLAQQRGPKAQRDLQGRLCAARLDAIRALHFGVGRESALLPLARSARKYSQAQSKRRKGKPGREGGATREVTRNKRIQKRYAALGGQRGTIKQLAREEGLSDRQIRRILREKADT